jgi:hypothetical protein
MKTPFTLLLILVGLVCSAQPLRAAGVNFSWDACTSEGGVQNKTFACDTNTGTRIMYGSFVLAADQQNFVGVEIKVDISAQADSLPSWWQFYNSGACRATALSVAFDFSSDPATSCTDPWIGQGVGGLGAYHTFWTTPQVSSGNRNEAQVVIAAAVPSTIPQQLTAGAEYYCFKLMLASTRTTGANACGGCTTPVCVALSEVNAVQNDGNHEALTQPVAASILTWQSAESCPGANAAQNITWGQIRSVLR